jgi:PKD repeat protein
MKTNLLSVWLVLFSIIGVHNATACKVTVCCGSASGSPVGKSVGFDRDNQSTKAVSWYLWDFGDGTIGSDTAKHVTHTYAKPGVYNVKYSVIFQDSSSCSASVYYLIIYDVPKFTIIGPNSGCYPLRIYVRRQSTSNTVSNTWRLGDTTLHYSGENTTRQIVETRPPADSLVSLAYTAKRGHFRLSLSQADTVHDKNIKFPVIYINYPPVNDSNQVWVDVFPHGPIEIKGDTVIGIGHTVKLTSISEAGEYHNFTWNTGNGNPDITQPDSSISFAYSLADYNAAKTKGQVDAAGRSVFVVRLKAKTDKGCSVTNSLTIHLDTKSGTEPSAPQMSGLLIYPNPFRTQTTVRYALDKKTNTRIEILDVTGKRLGIVMDETQLVGAHTVNIDAEKLNLKAGLYLLKISLDGENALRHLVKLD